MYKNLNLEEIQNEFPEFINIPRIVKESDSIWFVKYKPGAVDEEKRDLLAYLLGKNVCNIAEVKLLNSTEHDLIKNQLNLPIDSTINNTFLVRLANSYKTEELIHTTTEKAVASELIFSTWIRRRDTHADNRSYLHGIPIFYDHQTAFLAEPNYAHTTLFLRSTPDYGYPASWRVREITHEMTTVIARTGDKAVHYVNNLSLFKEELNTMVDNFNSEIPQDLEPIIKSAGFSDDETRLINEFLQNNLYTLKNDIKQLTSIILMI